MKNTLMTIGAKGFEYYIQPLPKQVLKAVLTYWIGTTAGLIIIGIIKLVKSRNSEIA